MSVSDTRQRPLFALSKVLCLPSVFVLHLANKFFSSSCPPNFSCSPHTLRGTRCSNLIYFSICLLFLINLFLLKVFSLISQIWTASESNNRIFLVEKWYSWYWVHCEALSMKWKKNSNILFPIYDHERVAELFLNSVKCKQSMKIMRFVRKSRYHTWRL